MRFFINDEHYPDAPPGVGPVAKVVDDIARMAELGVQHLELAMPPGPTTEAILEQMHRFVEDVRPQLPASCTEQSGGAMSEPNDLERRIRAIEDRIEIEDVIVRYADAVDFQDDALLETCFTDDADGELRRRAGRSRRDGHRRVPRVTAGCTGHRQHPPLRQHRS